MHATRSAFALFLLAALSLISTRSASAHEGAHHETASRESIELITDAARVFLDSLSPEQVAKARYVFDDEKRLIYRTIPFSIPGLQLGEMSEGQKPLVHALLASSLSAAGYRKATSIIRLEEILVAMETASGSVNPAHGTDKYSVAVFGEPSATGAWSWRIHGHHLYLAFTIVNGRFFASGPAFFGAEPHRVNAGPNEGLRVLADEEDLARAFMNALTPEERATATLSEDVPRDLFSGSYTEFSLDGPPKGIAFRDLSAEKQEKLRAIVTEYVRNVPESLQHSRWSRIEAGGWDNVHFAWMGSIAPEARNYYRVQGPEFLIEYCAVALTANHVHTVWREFNGDFGRDLLREHYQQNPH